ncbi:hypothetical protein DD238_007908 [Peronospora effusa]|uniref:Uncharacterized protein n=1 Tax=Peronospora effusa TaxID=542832 RepID=A0A3M6V8L6_9STRA|nr:hypothetical protein DD238_007908 [Peronospora effusa]
MEEKALAVREKCNVIQEQVTAKERRLRKDESKYRKLKKEYDGMASAEVDLSNSLEDCEEMLEENAKRDILKAKLTSLHTAFITEQVPVRVFSRMNQICPRKRQKKSKNADRDEAIDEQKEEHIEDEDSNEEE